MIALDTSALMAIVLDEPQAAQCISAIEAEDELIISAGTVAEVLIVSARRNVAEEVAGLLDGLGVEVVNVSAATARRVSAAYSQWGKGVLPASLNFGDCLAYEVAKERGCRLLFVGDDFTETDVDSTI